MYAVVKTGGKQYRIKEGDLLKVEKLSGEIGSKVELNEVLAVGDGDSVKLGTPTIEKARVLCKIVEQDRARKIIVFKKKRRQGYKKRQGHRQSYTALQVDKITS